MEPVSYGATANPRLDATFLALADPTRRAILARLAQGEASVTELAAPFTLSQPAISKHIKVLERAGLVSRSRDAQRRPCRIEAGPLAQATGWLERYRNVWTANFERLDALLNETKPASVKQKLAKAASVKSKLAKAASVKSKLAKPASVKSKLAKPASVKSKRTKRRRS